MAAIALGSLLERLLISSSKCNLRHISKGFLSSPALTCGVRTMPTAGVPSVPQPTPSVQRIVPSSTTEQAAFKDIAARINQQLTDQSHGRLFAVVHLCGKQFKITNEDLIAVEGNWAPDAGDRIRLEKVLLVGGSDFTLVGRPLLPQDLVHVEATVVEKTVTHTKTMFRKRRRKQYMRIHFFRHPLTTLRITAVRLTRPVDSKAETEGLEGRVF